MPRAGPQRSEHMSVRLRLRIEPESSLPLWDLLST